MKKRGYTLVELLGILAVMAIMLLITVPAIIRTMKNADNQKYIAFQNIITNAAETYYESDPSKYPLSNGVGYILVQDIIDAGYLKSTITDPKTGKLIDGGTFVEVKLNDDKTKTFTYPADLLTVDEIAIDNVCTDTKTTECYKKDGDEYIYTGASGTGGVNWLWYGGHQWRIIKVNASTKKATLITSYPVTAISWGSTITNGPSLEESYVGDWLNNIFVKSLQTNIQSKLENMTYTRKVYNGSSVVEEEISNVKVRLLTESEYTTYGGADSYLDIKNWWWLADICSSSNVRSVDNGDLSNDSPSIALGVRAIVEISDITITEGDGTLTALYIGNTSKATNVSDIAVGEYISIPKSDGGTYLARVVKHDQNGTKVILNGLYTTSKFGSNTTFSTSSTIYTGALTEFKNSLDSNYFDSTNREFNMTMYGSGANYADTITMFNGNISLPSVGEMFSGNDIDVTAGSKTFVNTSKILNPALSSYYWLMNASSSSYGGIVSFSGVLNGHSPSRTYGVRSTWYVKNVKITGGSGTANDPYTLK